MFMSARHHTSCLLYTSTTAETETDEPETETVEDAENADSEAAETADTQSQATALEVTDRFAQQTAVDEALLQEASNGYSLDEALIVVNPYGICLLYTSVGIRLHR